MNKPLVIEPQLMESLAALSREQRIACWEAMQGLPEAFGHPHIHSGLGVRKLRRGFFECRAGLGLRLLFRDETDGVHLFFVGNHDDVQRELRNGRHG